MPAEREPRRIEYLSLRKLEPDPRNPKAHSESAISASVERFGFVEPIVLDGRTGYIASGHGRVETLTRMMRAKSKPPEGVRVTGKGDWLVPVVTGWASENDAEAGAALIAFNRTTELGGWVDEALLDLLDEIEGDESAAASGFDDDDLEALRRVVAEETAEPAKPRTAAELDDAPELRKKPRSKPGDIWQLGPHRVMCGSSTSPDDVARLLAGATPELLLTDPPYSSGGFQEAGRGSGSIGTRRIGEEVTILNDTLSTRGYQALMKSALQLAPTVAAYVFTDWRMWVNLYDVLESSGYGVRSMIVWDKGSPGMGAAWRSQHELVAWAVRAKLKKHDPKRSLGNVRAISRSGNPLHPTQKPVKLLTDLLHPLAGTGVTGVYDPFGGSGSTLIAADEAGYPAFVMELDPGFVDVIVDRWEGLTGKKATRSA